MHEGSFARAIILTASKEAEKAGIREIKRIKVAIGEIHAVVEDFLITVFDMMKGEYGLEEASLEVEKVPLKVRCASCGRVYSPEEPVFLCPYCGAMGGEVLQGEELHIISIEGEK